MSKAGWLHAGSCRTQEGLSHSWDRPTSISPAPRAQTISVAPASRETTRTLSGLVQGTEGTPQQRIAAENRQRVDRVARDLILVKRNAGCKPPREPRQRIRIEASASP